MKVNVYDFDGTIYDGDSTIDFYLFCLKKKKSICKYLFKQVFYMFLYLIKVVDKTKMKEIFFIFLKDFDNIDDLIDEFWKKNFIKIKKWYLDKEHDRDIIISASPYFLLEKGVKNLKIKDLIASDVSKNTGKFNGKNCYGSEKVKRLKDKYSNVIVENIYSDSYSDKPLFDISHNVFLVKKDKIKKLDYYNK